METALDKGTDGKDAGSAGRPQGGTESAPGTPLLSVTGLSKSFASSRVLKGIDLTVSSGDVVAVLGPSGSGKTTLLRCLNFLERAEEGVLTFRGESFSLNRMTRRQTARIRSQTGFVFQGYNLFRNKTVLQNVTEGLTTVRRIKRPQAEETARIMLGKVGMLDKEKSFPHELSGGQQQRVAIARAMAYSPALIYFDEPTSALDPELIGEVLSVMRDLAQSGMTMLVVTHELNFARNVSNRVIFMEDGKIIEQASSRDFFETPRSNRVQAFLSTLSREK